MVFFDREVTLDTDADTRQYTADLIVADDAPLSGNQSPRLLRQFVIVGSDPAKGTGDFTGFPERVLETDDRLTFVGLSMTFLHRSAPRILIAQYA